MSDSSKEPQWQHLPYNPKAFFELEDNYTRVDLKRAYNYWLKRFKPEKHPVEFQKIREAYVRLEQLFSGGIDHQADGFGARLEARFVEPVFRSKENVSELADENSPQPTLTERIQSEPLRSVYDSLVVQGSKSPADYYYLAVLSDLVETELPTPFLEWILRGLEAYPTHYFLIRILKEYLDRHPEKVCEDRELLARIFRSCSGQRFFFVTEEVWRYAVERAPWPTVQARMEECERLFIEQSQVPLLRFYIRFLRQAVWYAPLDWIRARLRVIEEHATSIVGAFDFQHELTSHLIDYVEKRSATLQLSPLSQRIDQAIKGYCCSSRKQALQAIVDCQFYIAMHPEELLRLFAPPYGSVVEMARTWMWIADDCNEKTLLNAANADFNACVQATRVLMEHIDQLFPRSPLENYQTMRQLAGGGIYFLLFFLGAMLRALPTQAMILLGVLLVLTGVGYFVWFKPRIVVPWFDQYLGRLIRQHYVAWWRSVICRFFAATNYPYAYVRRAIDFNLQSRSQRFNTSTWLPYLLPEDIGLQVYSVAVRFRR